MLHPYANLTTPGIDVFHGGSEMDALNEAARLASDCIKFIPKNKRVLLINTLVDAQSFEEIVGKYSRRAPRLKSETYLDASFMEKLSMIERSITTLNIAVLVLTNFDCAALNQRHRVLLGQRLRAIRNTYKIRIIVFMQNEPGYYGVNGSLRYASRMMTEVGAFERRTPAEIAAIDTEEAQRSEEQFVREMVEEREAMEREAQRKEAENRRLAQRTAIVMRKYGLLRPEDAAYVDKIIVSDPIGEEEEIELLASTVRHFDDKTFGTFLAYFKGNFDTEVSQIARLEFQRRQGHGNGYIPKPRTEGSEQRDGQPLQDEALKNKELAYADVA